MKTADKTCIIVFVTIFILVFAGIVISAINAQRLSGENAELRAKVAILSHAEYHPLSGVTWGSTTWGNFEGSAVMLLEKYGAKGEQMKNGDIMLSRDDEQEAILYATYNGKTFRCYPGATQKEFEYNLNKFALLIARESIQPPD